MYANKNYEEDIRYTMQLNRIVFRFLGILPYTETKPSFFENVRRILLILSCYFLLYCELVPMILYLLFVEKQTSIRLKLMSSVIFSIMAVLKYSNLMLSRNRVKTCLLRVKDDWQNVASARARDSMIDKARTARRLLIVCGIFMYSSGLYFRTIAPLSRGKSVTEQNLTIGYLACPAYFVFFNAQVSPAYEVIFLIQLFSGFIKYTITVAICSLAALFVMHLCAQLEVLMMLMNNLVSQPEAKDLDERLAVTVEHQIKIRRFLQLVQNTMEFTSLLELMGCTGIVCCLGYGVLVEWEKKNIIGMCSCLVLLVSIWFNIFIFCFIGEQLSLEGEKLALTACTLTWYHLPDAKVRALILIIAMSIIPTKLKAGKFIDLSMKTFSDVVKTSLTYFNLMRQVME